MAAKVIPLRRRASAARRKARKNTGRRPGAPDGKGAVSPAEQPEWKRLDCELKRVLGASPASAGGRPPPTFAEVRNLLALSSTALRRHSDDPGVALVALIVELLMRHMSADDQAARLRVLRETAERLLHAVGLRRTPIGDRIEDELAHPGELARSGRRLAWLVARMLEIRWTEIAAVAISLADALSGANGSDGITSELPRDGLPLTEWWEKEAARRKTVQRALARELNNRQSDIESDLFTALRENAKLREELAIDLVVAAATASGFKRARERLFDAHRVRQRRRLH
jgi:hypothetical protein